MSILKIYRFISRLDWKFLSSVFVIVPISISVVFLFAYLSTFDNSLILMIDYQDIFRFSFFILGIMLGSILSVLIAIEYFLIFFISIKAGDWGKLKTPFCILVIMFASDVLNYQTSNNIKVTFVYYYISIFLLLGSIYFTWKYLSDFANFSTNRALNLFVTYLITLASAAGVFANYIKDNRIFVATITLKSSKSEVGKLFFVGNKFLFFLKNNVVYVVPTDEIQRIEFSKTPL